MARYSGAASVLMAGPSSGARSSDEFPVMDEIAPANILIVDDHPANLMALEALLEPLKQRVVKAGSGDEALKLLLTEDFALILLDVQMPGIDGFETAKLVKAHKRTAAIPIIFVTAISRDAANVFKGYAHGAVDYLLKPIDPDILRAKVSTFLELYRKNESIKAQAKLLRERDVARLESRNEQRFRRLTDSMPLAVWAAGPDGDVHFCNRAWTQFSRLPFTHRDHREDPSVVHPDDFAGVNEARATSLRNCASFEMEYRLRRHDGQYLWHLGRAVTELGERGEVIGWIVTATEIDVQKRADHLRATLLEQEIRARKEAESANRAKDDFLATVSHELRTPLNSILGWSRLLRGGKLEATRVQQALETIERNANAQAALVNDLLDVTSIIAGKVRLAAQRTNMAAIIRTAVETVRPVAEAKGVVLSCSLEETVEIMGDAHRLQQVMWNLVTNAVKFTPAGGQVTVRTERNESCELIVRVSDDGQGISPDFLPFVFDRFRQADSGAARSHAGLGLGLSIARDLVALHGGSLHAASEGLGKGAEFTLTLPGRANQPEGAAEVGTPRKAAAGDSIATRLDGLTVLFVDDDDDGRELFTRVLASYGARVIPARSAVEALRALDSDKADVLVSDIGLPGYDGYALMRDIRARSAEAGGLIPAIAVTGFMGSDAASRARKAGFQEHLAKPVEPAELAALVGTLAGRGN